MDKDILNALAEALMGTGSTDEALSGEKWYVCVYGPKGYVKKQQATSLFQAEITVTDYLHAGWAAWLQDHEGNHVVVATRPKELN